MYRIFVLLNRMSITNKLCFGTHALFGMTFHTTATTSQTSSKKLVIA